jgi:hypothetical protein
MNIRGKNMRGNLLKKEMIFGIIILLTSTSLMPVLSANSTQPANDLNIGITSQLTPEKTTTITFYVFEKTKVEKHTMTISIQDATTINNRFQELKKELAVRPYDGQTKQHVQQFINLLEEKHALPTDISTQELSTLLQPPTIRAHPLWKGILPLQGQSSEWFCNFATTGTGAAFPIIILPRIIPFILIPIPRIFVMWSTPEGITSVGGLISHTGFIAGGQQKGLALGFWGIGFSIFLPPFDQYGIFGYALFARVTADYMEFWPPNSPPKITQTDPADGQTMVSLSTKELRFSISDADTKDRMSYDVTTNPDIGSGSGGLKPSGTYSITVSGLESLTNYTWKISVTDGKDTTQKTFKFTTEPVGPIISKPVPANGERDVPMNLPQLQFTLRNYQGLAMEYTVQTSPNVGSDHKTGVHDGTYTVPLSGMTYGVDYTWYVNATDGTYWGRKVYHFQTGYPSPFDPFAYGWQYRKQITIDHTQVGDDLTDFTILVSTVDPDFTKAQADGGDILFMSGPGAATKWHHELETFNQTSGELVAWVNVPSLSSSEDTTFYMYYGNPTCVNQEYPEKTWESHYLAVWHMNDATSTTIKDSTINGNDATKKAANQPAEWSAKIGKGQRYDRTGSLWDYIAVNDPNALTFSGDFTISSWIYPYTTENMRIAGKHQDISGNYKGYSINWDLQGPGTKMSLRVDGGGYGYQYIYANEERPPNEWYSITGEKQSGTNLLFIDGEQQAGSGTQGLVNSDFPFCIGAWRTDVASANFNGIIDEVRVSSIGRFPAWITTEYNTMNNNQFLTIGPEEP